MVSFNRLSNTKNPYQGTAKKVLCVCSAGLLRSPTAAVVLQREFGFNTRAVGTSEEYALIPLDQAHVHWADEIVVMDSHMEDLIKKNFPQYDKPIIVLEVPDQYPYMHEELQALIKEAYEREITEDSKKETKDNTP